VCNYLEPELQWYSTVQLWNFRTFLLAYVLFGVTDVRIDNKMFSFTTSTVCIMRKNVLRILTFRVLNS
jgi:hypothetical protein